jgi:hypothetical protein
VHTESVLLAINESAEILIVHHSGKETYDQSHKQLVQAPFLRPSSGYPCAPAHHWDGGHPHAWEYACAGTRECGDRLPPGRLGEYPPAL